MNTIDEFFDRLEESKTPEKQLQLEKRRQEYWQNYDESKIPELASFHIQAIKKMLDTSFTEYNSIDIVDLVWTAVSKAYEDHDPAKGEYSTFLGHVVETTFIDYLRTQKRRRRLEQGYSDMVKCHLTREQEKKLGYTDPETGQEFTLDNAAICADDFFPDSPESKLCELWVKLPDSHIRFLDYIVGQTDTNRTAVFHNLIHMRLIALDLIMLGDLIGTEGDNSDVDRRKLLTQYIKDDVECCRIAGSKGRHRTMRVTTAKYVRPLLKAAGVTPSQFIAACIQRYANEIQNTSNDNGPQVALNWVRKLPELSEACHNNIQ